MSDRTEPVIDVKAAQKFMPKGFPILDPDEPICQIALAGTELEPWGSMHLAGSNRALWRRVAELEALLKSIRQDVIEERSHAWIEGRIDAHLTGVRETPKH